MSSLVLIELEFRGSLSDLGENLRSGDCWGVNRRVSSTLRHPA
jgi:hypothetical protein